jgi:hypothetical protein
MLRLVGQVRHELACATCGAPLSEMKPLRVDRVRNAKRSPRPYVVYAPRTQKIPARKVKRDWDFWDDLWDDIEEFFDDLEDWFD